MLSPYEWLKTQSKKFSKSILLIDSTSGREVNYEENFQQVELLIRKLKSLGIKPGDKVVFFGNPSIESYQLYYAIVALQAIWVPIGPKLDRKNIIQPILENIGPKVIIYDHGCEVLAYKIKDYNKMPLSEIQTLPQVEEDLEENTDTNTEDPIISAFLTSGSTGLPKIVLHGWGATLYHAKATVKRYPFKADSCLFNPRPLFGVSGTFPLITLMSCGGSIVIAALKEDQNDMMRHWAESIKNYKVTHVSFFPDEMRQYARFIDNNAALIPSTLKRITTGGEPLEMEDLISIARVFEVNKTIFDLIYAFYPYCTESIFENLFKWAYEIYYGALVQVTQTYGATEGICNLVANDEKTGPDSRGIGSPLESVHPELVSLDDEEMILPHDDKHIGRLVFFGNSLATAYYNSDSNEQTLEKFRYKTGDLASISSNGGITLYGRVENIVEVNGKRITPLVIERSIKQACSTENVCVFKFDDFLHVAVAIKNKNSKDIISKIVSINDFELIKSISIWDAFPVANSGKIDKKAIMDTVNNSEIEITYTKDFPNKTTSYCLVM